MLKGIENRPLILNGYLLSCEKHDLHDMNTNILIYIVTRYCTYNL